MSAVSPTEIASPAKAIRRHDCQRGKQDCLLHGFGCGLPRYGVRLLNSLTKQELKQASAAP